MKTFQDYIDLYGWGGYKAGYGLNAPLVAMLRDEVSNPGSTELSAFDRASLVKLNGALPTGNNVGLAEQFISTAELPFLSLRFDGSKVPQQAGSTPAQLNPLLDAAYKQYGAVIFTHGEQDNPFIQHTDRIENNGTIKTDDVVGTDVASLSSYYHGAVNATITGTNFFDKNNMVHTTAEMTNMLKLVIQYDVDTADNVQKYFGNYVYAPGVAATAIAAETKLPAIPQLNDPNATVLEKAYIAYYGRPADPAGLAFWVDAVKKTGSVTDMVSLFGNSDEYHHLYSQASSTTLVNSLYQHLFNRDAETAGLNFWAQNVDAGKLTLANVAYELVNGAQGTDLTILSEKISAATTFTASLDTQREVDLYSNDLSALNARKWLSTIGADHTANVQIVGIANDVINQLQSSADGVLSGHGLHPTYF